MMSIESDIVTATPTVAGGRFYPIGEVDPALFDNDGVPKRSFVAYQRSLYEHPQYLGGGGIGLVHSEFTFECWGVKSETQTAKASALALAADLRTALEASATLTANNRFEIPTPGDQYEPDVLQIMEPVSYSFWHAP